MLSPHQLLLGGPSTFWRLRILRKLSTQKVGANQLSLNEAFNYWDKSWRVIGEWIRYRKNIWKFSDSQDGRMIEMKIICSRIFITNNCKCNRAWLRAKLCQLTDFSKSFPGKSFRLKFLWLLKILWQCVILWQLSSWLSFKGLKKEEGGMKHKKEEQVGCHFTDCG